MAESPWIIETSTEAFEADVLERSKDVPVVVDFWATWCNPCRQLAPILENLAVQFDGRFILVKVDVEQNQAIASMFGIQQIPRVIAFRDGQPVNQFMGVLPEPQLRDWLTPLLPTPAQELIAQGAAMETNDPAAAEEAFRKALEVDPEDAIANRHLAGVLLAQGQHQQSAEIIAELENRGYLEPEAEQIKARLELAAKAAEAGDLESARQAAAEAPDQLDLQLQLAGALIAAEEYPEAMDVCLTVIQRDKFGVGVTAKETMLEILGLLGSESEVASAYRRKLATALY
jgi:putative thioredoxin